MFMLLLPTIGLLYLGASGALSKYRLANEMEAVHMFARLAVKASSLVHEIQKERGMTAGFIGSKGTRFGVRLLAQQKHVDSRINAFETFMDNDFDKRLMNDGTAMYRKRIMESIDAIAGIRQRVKSLNIKAGDAIAYYSRLNASLLGMIGGLAGQTTVGRMVREITAYVNFLQSKERAGIERAVLANTFARDRFGLGMFNKLIALIAVQDTYMSIFQTDASHEAKAFYAEEMQSPFVKETKRMRSIAIDKASKGGFGIDPGHWFDQQTGKINLLKKVEDRLSSDLLHSSGMLRSQARLNLDLFAGLTLFIIIFSCANAFLVMCNIKPQMARMVSRLKGIAEGDLTRRIDVDSTDEIGQLGASFNTFADRIQGTIKAIGENAQTLTGASEQMTAVSTQMGANAEETSAQANVVSAAAEQISANIQTVATGMEELSASTQEIASNATEAAGVAAEAVEVTHSADHTISKLDESSAEIGEIINTITSIAQQTRLLALNATIEAARAGEAGKGFAVVANEVKDLAMETARASDDISRKIGAIQGDTRGAVDAIARISEIITKINEFQTTIASAVEEQSATANEIARNVNEAASGSTEIARNITGVAEAAQSTSTGANDTQAASGELASMAAELQQLVGQFRYT